MYMCYDYVYLDFILSDISTYRTIMKPCIAKQSIMCVNPSAILAKNCSKCHYVLLE